MVWLSAIPFTLGVILFIYVIHTVMRRRDKNMSENSFTVARMPAFFVAIMPAALLVYGFVMVFMHLVFIEEAEMLYIAHIAFSVISVLNVPLIVNITRWGLVFDRDTVRFIDLYLPAKTFRVNEITISPAVQMNTRGGEAAYSVSMGKKTFLVMPNCQGYKLFFDKFIRVDQAE